MWFILISVPTRLHYSRLVPEFKGGRWPEARACWESVQGRRSDAILLRSGLKEVVEKHLEVVWSSFQGSKRVRSLGRLLSGGEHHLSGAVDNGGCALT
ncbi:hypothetical protein DPX16_10021 [Anabarilius grahami]|uniref:Uncharacterized protein n=1 Tax=Anabarilius grahami TaxID=495550 RepID=A0A3N0XX59_ANAGA|nr:hypothetical protein DPX16_10021 [Anabarilius grahami]